MRNPGARGVKLTVAVQELPPRTSPVQVLPPSVKSRPGAPCVTTWTEAPVTVDVGVKVTWKLLVHPEGFPPEQTLAVAKFAWGAKLALTFSAWLIVTTQIG
jgi:hypothetical protein